VPRSDEFYIANLQSLVAEAVKQPAHCKRMEINDTRLFGKEQFTMGHN
jgi:hypothetical protein